MKTDLTALATLVIGFCCCGWLCAAENGSGTSAANASLRFAAASNGEFSFDTGVLRGKLRSAGKSLGVSSLVHVPTGKRLDRSNGLLSHYRVFTKGARYGAGAWDWPSEARLREDGAVEVHWPAAGGRPFTMQAVYRWHDPATLDLETRVHAQHPVTGFESFLACYFHEAFTNLAVRVADPTAPQGRFMPGLRDYGDWLMFPRNSDAHTLIQDGRWTLEPHPVDWKLMPAFAQPIARRVDPISGITAVLMSRPQDCFAIACPYETEAHYSLYLSLFGTDLAAGETRSARTRLWIAANPSDSQILSAYQKFIDSK